MVTLKEAANLLNAYARLSGEEDYDSWSWVFYELTSKGVDIDGFHLSCVTSVGGEGQGDEAYLVVMIESPEQDVQYFRKDGYYVSYDGFTWDGDFYEVTPRERTITVYEDKVGSARLACGEESFDSFGVAEDDSFGY